MKDVNIFKAQRIGSNTPENVSIKIETEFPELKGNCQEALKESESIFRKEAQTLEDVLYKSLPGGTYDRLLGLMLARKASHFIVSYPS